MVSHYDKVSKIRCKGNVGGWQERHMEALRNPVGCELPVVGMLKSWLKYADSHQRRYESKIGDDGFLGEYWSNIGKSLRQLLNGEIGRLDAGTIDSIIVETLTEEGFGDDL